MPEINLRSAIIPLYLAGKLFFLNAFSYGLDQVYDSDDKDNVCTSGDHDDVDDVRKEFRGRNTSGITSNNTFRNANHFAHYDNSWANNHYRNGIIITASGGTTISHYYNKSNKSRMCTTLRNRFHRQNPAPQRRLKMSIAGIVHVIAFCIAYGAYHVYWTFESFSKTKRPDLARMVIDLTNQYAGCCLVVTLVSAALVNQHLLMKLINTLFEIDDLLMSRLNIAARNGRWLLHIATLLIASLIIKITIGVWFYSVNIRQQNSITIVNLLLLRHVPRLMCLISELQYIALVLLIKDRYIALQGALAVIKMPSNDNGEGKTKEKLRTVNRLAPKFHYPKGFIEQDDTSMAAGNDCRPKNVTNQSMTGKLDGLHHRLKCQARTNQLRHIYEIYLRLRETIQLTNRSFGVRNLILILYHFETVVEMSYMACMIWVREIYETAHQDGETDLTLTVFYGGSILLELFAICFYGQAATDEGNTTRQLILTNLHSETGSRFSVNPSIGFNLLDQRFDCLGLFDVDLSLFYGIVGAMTTYLIILIQFRNLGSLG